MFKRITAILLLIFFCNLNFAYAQNWVTITAENGKSADLDLDSIKMVVDTVEYDIKTTFDDVIYINKLSTDLYKEGMPSAVIERKKYKNEISELSLISEEVIKNREYKTLKPGTLQAEIFDVLSKRLQEKTFNEGYKTWKKYLKTQRKTIQKTWKPIPFRKLKSVYMDVLPTPYYKNRIELDIDKNGVIQQRRVANEEMLLEEVYLLEPLPDEYKSETFQLGVNVKYYKYAGAKLYSKKPEIKQASPVKAEINIAKNSRPPIIGHIQFGMLVLVKKLYSFFTFSGPKMQNVRLEGPLVLLAIPVVAMSFVGWLVFSLFAMLIGVSANDI